MNALLQIVLAFFASPVAFFDVFRCWILEINRKKDSQVKKGGFDAQFFEFTN